jgi:hypothetical protein
VGRHGRIHCHVYGVWRCIFLYFGVRQAGAIIGSLYTSVGIGSLVGPTLAGVAFDWHQSYTLPILVSVAANLIAVCCLIVIGHRSNEQ